VVVEYICWIIKKPSNNNNGEEKKKRRKSLASIIRNKKVSLNTVKLTQYNVKNTREIFNVPSSLP